MNKNMTESTSSYFEQKNTIVKKPKGVLIILILSSLALLGILPTLAIINGIFPIDKEVKELYYTYNGFSEYAILIILPTSLFIASLFLFKLKKIAVKLFIGVLIVKILTVAYKFSMENYIESFSSNPIGTILNQGFAILIFIFALWYVIKLDKEGVLKP